MAQGSVCQRTRSEKDTATALLRWHFEDLSLPHVTALCATAFHIRTDRHIHLARVGSTAGQQIFARRVSK